MLVLQDKCIVVVPDWPAVEQFVRVASAHKKAFPLDNIFTALRLGPHVRLSDKRNQLAIEKLAFLVKHLELHLNVGPIEWRWLLFDQFVNLKELHFHGPVPFQPILASPVPDTGSVSPIASTSKAQLVQQGKIKELTNLKILVFNLKNRKTEDIFVRRFIRDIFTITPQLQSLEWIKDDRFANDFQKTMFDSLMKTKPGSMGRLETFRCPSLVCGTKELQEIEDRGFPLKEIHFQIAEVSAQYLENFLELHGGTLENVHFEFCPGSPLNIMVRSPLSGLAYLQELSLTEYRRSIGFVGYLPSLKKLTLTRTNIKRALLSIGWAFDSKDKKELSLSLQELYVYNDYLSREHGNCTREIVLKLAHCFPNLRVIRMEGLDDSSIRHLFKSFPCLEELYAPAGTYSDEAFRSYTCKEQLLHSGGLKSPNRYHLSAFDASHLKSKNFIKDWIFSKIIYDKNTILVYKDLRTLELESIGLTDKFVTHGIINWRSLRNLIVKYCRV